VTDGLAMMLAFEAVVAIGAPLTLGETPLGKRRMIPITGGHFEGPRLAAEVVAGGADWQTLRPDGVTEIHAVYAIRADDGTVIAVDNRGLATPGEGNHHRRTVCRFDAPAGPHDWLNKAVFIGTLDLEPSREAIRLTIYQLT
jgi:hypothetical protein